MDNKVILIYENNEYNIYLSGNIISTEKDCDVAIEKFKKTIAENTELSPSNWNSILTALSNVNDERLEINNEYKTITFGVMKYFSLTGKLFYIKDNQMQPLTGGIYTFKTVVTMATENLVDNYEEVLEFCTKVLNNKARVRMTESSIVVGSAAFHYGSAEFNFISNKINKGATIESGNFETFKKYVLQVLNS